MACPWVGAGHRCGSVECCSLVSLGTPLALTGPESNRHGELYLMLPQASQVTPCLLLLPSLGKGWSEFFRFSRFTWNLVCAFGHVCS